MLQTGVHPFIKRRYTIQTPASYLLIEPLFPVYKIFLTFPVSITNHLTINLRKHIKPRCFNRNFLLYQRAKRNQVHRPAYADKRHSPDYESALCPGRFPFYVRTKSVCLYPIQARWNHCNGTLQWHSLFLLRWSTTAMQVPGSGMYEPVYGWSRPGNPLAFPAELITCTACKNH